MRASDIDDQADSFLAVFWNENGNVSLCRVVFATRKQAEQWAEEDLKRQDLAAGRIRKDKDGVRYVSNKGYELGWRIVPAISAEPQRKGSEVSLDHVEVLR